MTADRESRVVLDEGALRELLENATQGEWFGSIKPNGKGPGVVGIRVDSGPGAIAVVNGIPGGPERVANLRLIALAPRLAEEVLELRARLAATAPHQEGEEVREALEECRQAAQMAWVAIHMHNGMGHPGDHDWPEEAILTAAFARADAALSPKEDR